MIEPIRASTVAKATLHGQTVAAARGTQRFQPTGRRHRRRSAYNRSSRATAPSELAALPDPAALEAMWRELGAGADDEALNEAQELVYEAWDSLDGRSRSVLARRALKVSPFCADAWLILAKRPSLSPRDRRAILERAVKAGELALGPDGFAEYAGHFWGFLETRPYMRARHALAEDLWQSADREAAIGHLREMLTLNPGDNQGLRFILLALLLRMRDDRAVEKLLRDHGDEASAFICYTQALFAFRKSGDSADTRRIAAEAWNCNVHVPRLLSRKGRVRYQDTGYYTMGGEDEAAYYLEEYGFAWKETPGAVEWLVEATRDLKPVQRGRGDVH